MINKENYEIYDIIPVVDNNIFQNFYQLLQTALTIPILFASCECSFSVQQSCQYFILKETYHML